MLETGPGILLGVAIGKIFHPGNKAEKNSRGQEGKTENSGKKACHQSPELLVNADVYLE